MAIDAEQVMATVTEMATVTSMPGILITARQHSISEICSLIIIVIGWFDVSQVIFVGL